MVITVFRLFLDVECSAGIHSVQHASADILQPGEAQSVHAGRYAGTHGRLDTLHFSLLIAVHVMT